MNKERYKYTPDILQLSDFDTFDVSEMSIEAEKYLYSEEQNGYVITTRPNQNCEELLTIHFNYKSGSNTKVENLIKLETGSSLKLVIHHHDTTDARIKNSLSIELLENSRLELLEIVDTHSTFISNVSVIVNRNSSASITVLDVDNQCVVRDQYIDLNESGAICTMNGLYITGEKEHVDNYIKVRHAVPYCTSNQLFKGILSGKSDGAFTGHILVEKDAQQTAAYQQNHNILLSDFAKINSRPQLEIYADDVKCNHGATVGRLDPEAIYYMRQRGITVESARRLQLTGFAEDVLRLENFEDFQSIIHKKIERKLAVI